MIQRTAIILEARSYLQTPFHHQARVKGVGVDCVGLVTGVAQALGVPFQDLTGYSREPDGVTLEREIAKYLEEVPLDQRAPGDCVTFWIHKPTLPCHIGILTDTGFIHTYANVGRVVEHGMTTAWLRHLSRAWRFPGVGPFTGTLIFPPKAPAQPPEVLMVPCAGCDCVDAAQVKSSPRGQDSLLRGY